MDVGLFNSSKNRQAPLNHQQPIRSAKSNTCSSEINTYYQNNVSTGSMNETKSSHNESENALGGKFEFGFKQRDGTSAKGQKDETEPEWFSFPASRHDVIDLHGFDDEESLHPNTPLSTDGSERPSSRNSVNNMVFDDFFIYNNRHQEDPKGRNYDHRRLSQNQFNRYAMDHNSYPRYRNPLHHSKCKNEKIMLNG